MKVECNASVKIYIFCLINLVAISEYYEGLALFKFIISFVISGFVNLSKENLSLGSQSLIVLILGWLIFSVFVNASMYGGKLRLARSLEKKSFNIDLTTCHFLRFLRLLFHIFLSKWFYLRFKFYSRKVNWQSTIVTT